MGTIDTEVKRIVGRLRAAQGQVRTLLKDRSWIDDARKYAERRQGELTRLVRADVEKVRAFLVREKKEVEKLQRRLPREIEKVRKYVRAQRGEFEKLLKQLKTSAAGASKNTTAAAKPLKKKGPGRPRKKKTTA